MNKGLCKCLGQFSSAIDLEIAGQADRQSKTFYPSQDTGRFHSGKPHLFRGSPPYSPFFFRSKTRKLWMPVGCRMKNAVADVGSQLALDTNHCWEDFKKPWRIPDSFGLDWESFSCGTLRWRLINTAAIINAWAVHELLHGFIGLGLRWGMSCKIQWRQIGLWMAYDLSPVYLDTWIGFHLFFFHPFHTQVLRQRRFMHWAFVSCGVRILRLSLARWWASKGTLTQVVTFLCGNFSQNLRG